MTEAERAPPCPACGATSAVATWIVTDKLDIARRPLTLSRCACGLVYQPRRFGDDELARWYAYMGHNPANFEETPFLRLRLARQLAPLARYRNGGRLLDVGCGGGLLLRVAERLGWTPYGTEISPTCATALRPLLGARLHEGDLATAPFEAGSFDVITLSEVIEHLPQPARLLGQARSLLRPGGALFLTTPNRAGLAGRILDDRWRVVGDEHLCYFTAPTLTAMLAREGFEVERVWSTGFDLRALRDVWPRHRATTPAPPAPATDAQPLRVKAPSSAAVLRARLLSSAIDVLNVVARTSGLGDGLRAIARRPASGTA